MPFLKIICLEKSPKNVCHLRFHKHSKFKAFFACRGPGTSLILKELPVGEMQTISFFALTNQNCQYISTMQ